jgi:ABC-type protease/lipase transport system fused ATPase/permease subunit
VELLKMLDYVNEFLAVVLAAVAFLAWLIRLEAKALGNEKEIKRLWQQRKEDLEQAQKSRDETNTMLSEMRADIKMILQNFSIRKDRDS